MNNTNETFINNNKLKQDSNLVSVSNGKNFDRNKKILDSVVLKHMKVLLKEKILSWDFERFLTEKLKINNLNLTDIEDSYFRKEKQEFTFIFKNGEEIIFKINDIKEFLVSGILKGDNKKNIETKVKNIEQAIDSIYEDNKGYIYNDEINNEDIIKDGEYKGMTLAELKNLLDIENEKLLRIYNITGETNKKHRLLKTELLFYTGIGDKYEGGARYFSMTSEEINNKVNKLINTMSNSEVFEYIRENHNLIEQNYKKSDLVKQVNGKLMDSLSQLTLKKLIDSNASNKDFIEFAKVLTGRGKKINSNDENIEYEELDMDVDFRAMDIANKAIIYVMNRKGGVIENIINKKNGINNIEIKDEELEGKEPKQIVENAVSILGNFGKNLEGDGKTGEQLLKDMKLGEFIGIEKKYNDLTFEEKIKIGAIARIINIIKETSVEEIKENPQILHTKLGETMNDSFNDLNENLGKNFDGMLGLSGKSANELGLSGDIAEIFDLYQDMNGNGFWDLSDDNWWNNFSWAGSAAFGLSVVASGVAIALLIGSAPVSIPVIMLAGASAGAVSGLLTSILGKQGYDSTSEGVWDILSVMSMDAITGALFFLGSIKFFSHFFNIDILAQKLFSLINSSDMLAFGGTESLTNAILVTPFIGAKVKQQFLENHFDTNKKTN